MAPRPKSKSSQPDDAEGARRPVGRPRITETGQHSLSLLLNLVRSGSATTRQDLERQSELGRAVVTDRLATLISLGLLREGALGKAVGGRAPRQIEFAAQAGAVLLAVVDHTVLAVGLADLSGRLVTEHHESLDLGIGPTAITDRLTTLFRWLLEEHGSKVWGIGVAVPVPVGRSSSNPFSSSAIRLQAWEDFPFVEQLSARFDASVHVRSSVQTMTMGEYRAGAGADVSDMLFVQLDRTISAGVISEGRLHRGSDGAAGLIGHTAVNGETLDAVAGADSIDREAREAAGSGRSRYLAEALSRNRAVSTIDVGHAAQLGDAFCMELLSRCGRLIGEALAPLVNLLNPSLIVVGGSVAQTGDTLLAAIREAIYRQSHPLATRDLKILRSQMSGSAGLVGAAHVVTEDLFAPEVLSGWITLGTPKDHPEFQAFLESARARISAPPARPIPPAPSSRRVRNG
jgi:predicted NBD/HSP70 family sugar kinase